MPDVVPTLEAWHTEGIIDLNDLDSLGDRLVAAYCKGVGAGHRALVESSAVDWVCPIAGHVFRCHASIEPPTGCPSCGCGFSSGQVPRKVDDPEVTPGA